MRSELICAYAFPSLAKGVSGDSAVESFPARWPQSADTFPKISAFTQCAKESEYTHEFGLTLTVTSGSRTNFRFEPLIDPAAKFGGRWLRVNLRRSRQFSL